MNFEVLKSFIIDTWYKALMSAGAVFFTVSLFHKIEGLTNSELQMLSGGIFLIGLGEWKSHTTQSRIEPPNAYTGPAAVISSIVRKPDAMGYFFDAVGISLIGLAIWRMLHRH